MSDEKTVGAVQSERPEDTRIAREENLTGEDFDEPEELVMLTSADIAATEDEVLEKVPTPEWKNREGRGGFVYARNPTGAERNQFEQEGMVRKGRSRELNLRDLKERLVVWFACDDERRPLFCREDVKWLRDKNAAPINRIADAALRLGGWTDEDVEDLVGN